MKTVMHKARALVDESRALPGGMWCDLSRADGQTYRNMKSKPRQARASGSESGKGKRKRDATGFGGEPPVQHGRPSQPKPGLPFSKNGQEAIKRHKAEREAKAKAKSRGKVGEEAKPKGTQSTKATKKVCCVLHGWRGVRADTKANRCGQRPLGVAPRCEKQR